MSENRRKKSQPKKDKTSAAAAKKRMKKTAAPLPEVILNNTADLVAVIRSNYTVVYVNPAYYNELGYTPDDLVDQSITHIIHPDNITEFTETLKSLAPGEKSFTISHNFRNKSGNWLTFETTGSLVEGNDAKDVRIILFSRDMTIRVQTEAALAASEARYSNLTRVSPVGIFQCNANRFCLFVNERWSMLAGISQGEAIGEEWMVAVHPDDRLRILDEWYMAIRQNRPFKLEYRFQRPDKDVVWVYGEGAAVKNTAGKVTGYIETIIDITERKQTELALKESERRYRQLVDLSPDTVVVHSKGKIVYANAASVRMFDALDRSDFLGRNVLDFVHPEYRARTEKRLRRVYERETQGPPVHEKLITTTGKAIDAEVVAAPVTYMGAPAVQVVVRDITERMNTEKQMNMLAHAIRSISECISITDLEDRILFVNEAFEETYQYRFDELENQPINLIRSVNNSPGVRYIREQTLKEGWQGEVLNRRKDGSEFTVFLSTSLVRNQKGVPVAMIGIAKDITRQHRTERALKQTESQLRYIQKMEAVGRLAEGIAHDFNNLLTLITGYAQLLIENPKTPVDNHKSLQQILQSGNKGMDLIRQLLAFSRKQHLQPQVVDLNHIVTEMQNVLQQIAGKEIRLKINLAADLGQIKADREQLQQIILDLVSNARDAMPEGGKLTIKTQEVLLTEKELNVQISNFEAGRFVMMAVSDTGIGMPPETLSKVFEPFFTTKKSGRNTGLGLATVYGIVKQSGGYIWASSKISNGTTFKVYFPRIDDASA